MKIISDLYNRINENKPIAGDWNNKDNYYCKQFEVFGSKNILFVDVNLSSKHLYKMILPALGMNSDGVRTAFSSLSRFNQKDQLKNGLEIHFSSIEIEWADLIVIPFTTEALTEPIGEENKSFYDVIRTTNKHTKIMYLVDFNFYELSESHPFKKIFDEKAIKNVEDNIWDCDVCVVSNMRLKDYLLSKFKTLSNNRKKDVPTQARLSCVPLYIDTDILLSNVDYDPQEPKSISLLDREPSNKNEMESIFKGTESKKQIKVLYEDKKWVLKKGKYPKPIEVYVKKTMAIEETEKWSKKGYDIIIYSQDGKIQKSIIFQHLKNN